MEKDYTHDDLTLLSLSSVQIYVQEDCHRFLDTWEEQLSKLERYMNLHQLNRYFFTSSVDPVVEDYMKTRVDLSQCCYLDYKPEETLALKEIEQHFLDVPDSWIG